MKDSTFRIIRNGECPTEPDSIEFKNGVIQSEVAFEGGYSVDGVTATKKETQNLFECMIEYYFNYTNNAPCKKCKLNETDKCRLSDCYELNDLFHPRPFFEVNHG